MQRINKTISIFSLITLFSFLTNLTLACGCIGNSTVKKEIRKTDVVLKGKVVEKSIVVVDTLHENSFLYMTKYKIEVYVVYKGKKTISNEITIITGVGGGDCGYEFELGGEYIIYANYKNRHLQDGTRVAKFLYTNVCTRTTNEITLEEELIKKYRKTRCWRYKTKNSP